MKAGIASLALVIQSLVFAMPVRADTDNTSPVIVDILPRTGTVLGKGSVTFTIRAYDEHPGQLILTFGDENAVEPSAPPIDDVDDTTPTNMNATLTIDTNNFPDGEYSLHIKAIDEAGNSTERMARYSIDKQAPSVPTGGVPNETVRQAGLVAFNWGESSDSTSPEGIHYELRTSQDMDEVGVAPDNSSAVYKEDIPESGYAMEGVGVGTWYWQVRAVDAAGNKSAWSDVWNVTLDDTAPTIEVTTPSEGQLVGGDTVLTIASTVSDIHGLKAYGVLLDGVEVQKIVQPQNGVMDPIIVDLKDVQDGQHILTVFAIDGADIRSEVTRTFTLDVTAPAITTHLGDNAIIEGVTRLTVQSVDSHPFSHSLAIASVDGTVIADAIPLTMSDGAMYYDWNTLDVGDGAYVLLFHATDAAGNKTELAKTVYVKNKVASGMGAVLPSIPLVETLDVELSQPRLLGIVTPPVGGNETPQDTPSEMPAQMIDNARLNETIPIQSTESGWRLFGVLWYWWLLSAGALGVVGWWGWHLIQRRVQEIG